MTRAARWYFSHAIIPATKLPSLSTAGVFAFYIKVYIGEPTFLCRLSFCIWSTTKLVSYLEVGLNQEEIGIDPDNTIFLEIAWGYLVWIVQSKAYKWACHFNYTYAETYIRVSFLLSCTWCYRSQTDSSMTKRPICCSLRDPSWGSGFSVVISLMTALHFDENIELLTEFVLICRYVGPLLLRWINFNP